MKVSYTATQRGITPVQSVNLRINLEELKPTCFIHGGCIGGDDEGDEIAAELGIPRFVFPSDIPGKRVPDEVLKARGGSKVTIMPPEPPLKRNPKIVRAGDYLIGCPKERKETIRSGTWTTIRAARKRGIPVLVLEP